jgi:hypothetical protein
MSDLLIKVYLGASPSIVKELDIKTETAEIDSIEELIGEFPKLIKDDKSFKLAVRLLTRLEKLQAYLSWLEHPIYLNEFKDKYGNVYLQGRTSIKDDDGKTKWISAYVGALSDYPKGVNDPNALRKAKPLIRKKLKKFYGL